MKNVLCTVIEADDVHELRKKVGEFMDMDTSIFLAHLGARKFTHYQTEEGGIEYISLLGENGELLYTDTVVLCISRPVEAVPAT
jgi:hypothetical protein